VNKDLLNRLKGSKPLSEIAPIEFISTGCYALNRVITGDYDKGIPVGGIIQLRGDSSTGKTLFATTFLASAQKAGWYTKMLDAENTFSPSFAEKLGIKSETLLYSTPQCLEEAFKDIEETIAQIRAEDKKTPVLFVIDSVAVLPTAEEMSRDSVGDISNTDGARRAVIFGSLLRKFNHKLKEARATLVVINQMRSKINVMYGNPETTAAGGKALEFYLSTDLHCISNKTSDVVRGENKTPNGITGRVVSKKNKLGIPFLECEFKVVFDKGLDAFYGLEQWLASDGLISISSSGRRSVGDIQFKKNTLSDLLFNKTASNPELNTIRKLFSINQGTA
jgi:recombination protein RecA